MTTLLVLLVVGALVAAVLLVARPRSDDPAGEVERFQRARGMTTEWSRTGAVRAMAAPGPGESAPEPPSDSGEASAPEERSPSQDAAGATPRPDRAG